MIEELKGLTGKEVVKVLEKSGFSIILRKGSHIIMRKKNPFSQVVIPDVKHLDSGTLNAIIEAAGLSAEKFIKLI